MGWATRHIADLLEGRTVVCRPKGQSMRPRINSGDRVTIEPLTRDPQVSDIVLCKVRGAQFLHLVTAIRGDEYQISNNHGHVNGWCARRTIYGIVTDVRP